MFYLHESKLLNLAMSMFRSDLVPGWMNICLLAEFCYLLGRQSRCRISTARLWYLFPRSKAAKGMAKIPGGSCKERSQEDRKGKHKQ